MQTSHYSILACMCAFSFMIDLVSTGTHHLALLITVVLHPNYSASNSVYLIEFHVVSYLCNTKSCLSPQSHTSWEYTLLTNK